MKIKLEQESLLEVQANSSNTDKYKKITIEYGLEYAKMTIKLLEEQINLLREEGKEDL